jgi:hypothetical protein
MKHSQSLRAKYEADMTRLDAEYAVLDALFRRVPRSAFVVLLAPVLWYGVGWGAAVVLLLLAFALTATRAYLLAVRKSDNRSTRESLERELREQVGAREPTSSGWRTLQALI